MKYSYTCSFTPVLAWKLWAELLNRIRTGRKVSIKTFSSSSLILFVLDESNCKKVTKTSTPWCLLIPVKGGALQENLAIIEEA